MKNTIKLFGFIATAAIVTFALALTTLTLSACFSDWSGDTGDIIINLGGGSGGRTVLPWPPGEYGMLDDIEYEITLTGSGKTIPLTAKGGEKITATVSIGRWNVDVKASYKGDPYATGNEPVDVKAGRNNQVFVQMSRAIFTVTFDANGGTGTAPPAQTEIYGSTIDLPGGDGLTKSGFIFGGWNTKADGTGDDHAADSDYTVTANITLYAKWIDEETPYYTVTFNTNSGVGEVPFETVISGSSIALPSGEVLTKTGYTFDGWNTNAEGTGTDYAAHESYTVTTNITLYAMWKINQYTVIFDSNGGTPEQVQLTVEHGRKVEPQAVTRGGYSFEGWFSDDTTFDILWNFTTDTVTDNITLYAKWEIVDAFYVSTTDEWNTAVTTISFGVTSIYTINVTGDFSIPGVNTNTFTPTGITVNISGTGTGTENPTISLSSSRALLYIGENQEVTMTNLNLQGRGNDFTNNFALVYINGRNAKFTMNSGTISDNKVSSSDGGGVYVYMGTFTMNDGTISGNTVTSMGGGVYANGPFIMNGGIISGNTASGTNNGGGVYVASSTFTMNDGIISGNTVSGTSFGGGVYCGAGTFRIVNGTVYGSEATIDENLRNNANQGAALYVNGNSTERAQYGNFSIPGDVSSTWSSNGTLNTTNDTIKVVDGNKE